MDMKIIILTTMLAVCSLSMQAQFSGQGSGTEKDPYQVTNADELFEVRNDLSAHYKLMNDIDLGTWIKEENPNNGWNPIGTESSPFSGTFNGNNKAIKGLFIDKPSMNHVGLFGYLKGANLKNICLVNPIVTGNIHVGAIAGKADIHTTFYIVNCVCIGGTISGDACVGSILGTGIHEEMIEDEPFYIQGNFSSSSIKARNNSAGIIGFLYNYHLGAPHITDNHFNGRIECHGEMIGGLVGDFAMGSQCGIWEYKEVEIKRNLIGGCLYGNNYTNGLIGFANQSECTYPNYSHNVCYLDTLSGNSPKRIQNIKTSNNYGINTMVIISNGKTTYYDDDDYNGISLGRKTLMRKTTYEGMGFNFNNQWAISEGESFPYNINQSAPGQITEFTSGSRGKISGIAEGAGTVYVFIGTNMYESFIVDGKWEITLPNTSVGTEALVSIAISGKMPSIFVKAMAEAGGTPTPQGISGDANGDGVVDSADVTAIINFILGKPGASFNKENADVTGDGEILIDDAVQTVQLIMNAQ